MAVGDSLPASFCTDIDSSFSLSSSASSSSSCARRCRSFVRFSPCIFITLLLCIFLVFQYDLLPSSIDSPQLRDVLTKIRVFPLPTSFSPPTITSSSELSKPSSAEPSKSSSSESSEPSSPESSEPSSPESSATTSKSKSSSDPSTSSSDSKNSSARSRVAICIVGGARAFELTGLSIKKHLLQAVENSDVFLHLPFDKDSYKLSILKDVPNLVRFRVFEPQVLPETRDAVELLTSSGSPHGIQGLLQYFNLVEGCIRMIREYQVQQGFEYEWIIRTRLDGYWTSPLPSLDKMDPFTYTVPIGSQFGGLNDRLGIGNLDTSEVALSRLSLIPALHAHGARGLNSETSFKQQLKVRNISYKLDEFPFCILSRRKYGYPPGASGVPVLSISSKGNMNGAKCRPCTPASSGATAKSMIALQNHGWSWPGDIGVPELCNPTADWEPDWENIFDKVAGPESAEARISIVSQNVSHCIEANEELRKQVQIWDAPEPSEICKKGLGH